MEDGERRLDGNASAGLLEELFTFDVTVAQTRCANCDSVMPIGNLLVYGLPMGAILRCPGCDASLIRVTHVETGYWLDLHGTRMLHIPAEG
ncbi:MAG: DUF6510 family protein [Thermomicrobiales bacterium]